MSWLNKMIEILLLGLLNCITIQDLDEFGLCLDNVVLEYNQSINDNVSKMVVAIN